MHPLLQVADTALTKLSHLCDTIQDEQLCHELALIGLAVANMGESMEHLLHLLAHVPVEVRLKAAEDAKACDRQAELAETTETTETAIAHTLH